MPRAEMHGQSNEASSRTDRGDGSSDAERGFASPGHIVQFYESEHFLATTVAEFLATGLAAGQPVVVIATAPHRTALAGVLRSRGLDMDHTRRTGQLIALDARETLDRIMVGAIPDRARFRHVVGKTIERSRRRGRHAVVRLYGEMVDLLWSEGNIDGAIRLEELWNELADTYAFSLLCAYAMGHFYKETHGPGFGRICREHARVLPTERYLEISEHDRLLEVSRLQQRARALETEVEHRKELERRLREALAEQRRTEELLREREQELQDFLENAVEGIHWVGPDGTILWANRAELELLGYAREEYIGQPIRAFHVDPSAADEILARLARNETLRDHEAQLRCKDGSIKHVLINANVLWRAGRFIHTRCFTRDITDLKAAAAERERSLARERAARAEAEAANRAKSDFLAVMSHELRTPLNAIAGHVELIEMGVHGPVTDAQRQALARVQRSQRHLLSLITNVLNLARLEAGRMEYVLGPIPLRPLLADIGAMMEPLVWANRLTYKMRLPPDAESLALCGDQERVQQILLNLLTNAIKFTAPGGRITVEAGLSLERPAMICVHVRDTGIGIPAAKLESIFEPFVQLGARRPGEQDGVGLGLAISRDLARGMRGDLTVASTVGEGTTFTLSLPRA
jgi:PAS domain S-box-containing protein